MQGQWARGADERLLTVRVGDVGGSVAVLVGVHKQAVVRRAATHH